VWSAIQTLSLLKGERIYAKNEDVTEISFELAPFKDVMNRTWSQNSLQFCPLDEIMQQMGHIFNQTQSRPYHQGRDYKNVRKYFASWN